MAKRTRSSARLAASNKRVRLPLEEASFPEEEVYLLDKEEESPVEEGDSLLDDNFLPEQEDDSPLDDDFLPEDEDDSVLEEDIILADEDDSPPEEGETSFLDKVKEAFARFGAAGNTSGEVLLSLLRCTAAKRRQITQFVALPVVCEQVQVPMDDFLDDKSDTWASHDVSLDADWDKFVAALESLGLDEMQKRELSKPSGPRDPALTCLWHYPTFSSAKTEFGMTLDRTNPCLGLQWRKMEDHTKVRATSFVKAYGSQPSCSSKTQFPALSFPVKTPLSLIHLPVTLLRHPALVCMHVVRSMSGVYVIVVIIPLVHACPDHLSTGPDPGHVSHAYKVRQGRSSVGPNAR